MKVLTLHRLLEFRRAQPDLFQLGSYEPLRFEGARADHCIGYARRHGGKHCLVIVGRWFARLLDEPAMTPRWDDTVLVAETARPATDVLFGRSFAPATTIPLSDLLQDFPAAILFSED